MSHSVGEMKCLSQNAEYDFVGLKSFIMELNPSKAIMCRKGDLLHAIFSLTINTGNHSANPPSDTLLSVTDLAPL